MQYQLEHGDCLEVLRTLADSSIDAIVTDPPYGLSFMGRKWDYDVPGVEVWAECLRVLKPGGHLLAFAGTRTQHRMAARIEDAGFEIRDMIAWVYGSGFPKSLNVAKAIAATAGPVVTGPDGSAAWCEECGETHATIDMGHAVYCAQCAAREWQGWGTALKPALEPITVARKPMVGTVAASVLKHSTGAMNIEGCRVGDSKDVPASVSRSASGNSLSGSADGTLRHETGLESGHNPNVGRWPANLIHDGSEDVLACFPAKAGATAPVRGTEASVASTGRVTGERARVPGEFHGDTGSAARFFYCPKASRTDRNEGLPSSGAPAVGTGATMREREDADWSARNGNHHPTVKPTALMSYLCRLVTPPGGVVLDPFMGSGSTGKAAIREGFRFVGIEREAEYLAIAHARIEHEVHRHGALAAEPLPPETSAAVPEPPERHAPHPEPEPAQRGLF